MESFLGGGKKDNEDKETYGEGRKFTGKILRLYRKGYGFLSTPELEFTRVFFHWSVLTRESPNFTELTPNMSVEFTAREFEDKGWRAMMVKVNANTTKGER